ncbi:hypothetical protein IAR50_004915 [Cryptococcus sp. DSM 104548]
MSTTSTDKTVLITGANRGIGLALCKHYLEKGWTVVAAVRDLSKAPKLEGKAVVVKIDSSSLTDALDAIEELKTKHNITHLDVVYANAGESPSAAKFANASLTELDSALVTNVRGPVALYQATRPLLRDDGTFATFTSIVGSVTGDWISYLGSYGVTKTALNFIIKGIHNEEPKLKAIAIYPGWLDTDMGYKAAALAGIEAPPDTLSVNVVNIAKLVDEATKEQTSGLLWTHDGNKVPF